MRIRSIKPEFCSDEKIGALSPAARLHFILLWMVCDRHGVFENKPRQLVVQLYPYDEKMTASDFEALTSELLQQDLCSTAVVLQKNYCRVNNFNKHQMLTTWEKGHSKPLFTAKELRKHFGSTAEVLPSEERRGEECNEKSPPVVPKGTERVPDDVHLFLMSVEALRGMTYEQDLRARMKAGYEIHDPKLEELARRAADDAVIMGNLDHPAAWWAKFLEKNKTAGIDRGPALLGGECYA